MTRIISHHSQWNTALAEACTAYADALSSAKRFGDLLEANSRFVSAREEFDRNSKQQTLFDGALGVQVRRAYRISGWAQANGIEAVETALRNGKRGDALKVLNTHGVIDRENRFSKQACAIARFSAEKLHYLASCC